MSNLKHNSINADSVKEFIKDNFIKILTECDSVDISPKLYGAMIKTIKDDFETSDIEKLILENFVEILKTENPLDIQPALYRLMFEVADKYEASKKEQDDFTNSVLNDSESDLIGQLKQNIVQFKKAL